MNQNSYKVLEFERIKEEIAHFALTDSGKNKVMELSPSTNLKQIRSWLDEVTEAVQILMKSSSVPISGLNGIEQILKHLNKGIALRPGHLTKLAEFLICCQKLRKFMKDKEFLAPRVSSYVRSIEDLPTLLEEIEKSIRNGRVDDYASKELTRIRKQISVQDERLKEKVHQMIKSKKIKTYLQESIVSERNGRYVIPIKKEYKGKMKGTVLDTSASGATLYIEPEEITPYQEQIDLLRSSEEMEVERILSYLTGLVENKQSEIRIAVETMIHYDVLFAKAKYSRSIDGQSVEINDQHYTYLKNAKHPLLGNHAVPLTIELGKDYHALVITGPNTGGKTVCIKTVGLLTIMVQTGLHIPVSKGSHVSIYHHILLDIGDGQSIEQNLSTFSSHIRNIIEILKAANDHSLVLLDELGSGTDPGEGMGLATAILQQFYLKGATILATTHYSEIKKFADASDGFMNGSMEFDLETLKPSYRLLIGKGGESQAFAIALKLGMHPTIIENAHKITYKSEKEYSLGDIDVNKRKDLDRQISINRYARKARQGKTSEKVDKSNFIKGDNVTIPSTGEYGIVYNGPDLHGNYIVQIKNEKRAIHHKRLKLFISAAELYPEDYDFDIIFETKENRKMGKLLARKHVKGLSIERDKGSL